MSFAMTGITHCRECWAPLKEHEYGLCENCRKKEKEKKKKRGKKMSKKIYKGKEILKMIAEGQINKNTRVTVDNYGDCTLDFVFEDGRNLFKWLDEDFELIEDEIDMDSIKELLKIEEYEVDKTDIVINRNKINELVQAVKQLNKEIKSIKEK